MNWSRRIRVALSIIGASIVLGAVPRDADAAPIDWTVALDVEHASGELGIPLTFSGGITNATGTDIFVDLADLTFSGVPSSTFTLDFAEDFLATFGIIPVDGYTGPLFTFSWTSAAEPGAYGEGALALATFALTPSRITVPFSVELAAPPVNQVPEPASALLLLSGALAVLSRRGRRSSTARVR